MGIEEREAKWAKAMTSAREQGKDYVVRSYPEFEAKFIECVHEGCGWTEYLPNRDDWDKDPIIQSSLYNHTVKNHRGSQ